MIGQRSGICNKSSEIIMMIIIMAMIMKMIETKLK